MNRLTLEKHTQVLDLLEEEVSMRAISCSGNAAPIASGKIHIEKVPD